MHFSFIELKEYNTNPNNSEIESHLKACDICHNVLEGIRLTNEFAQMEGITSEEFISRSKASVKNKIYARPKSQRWMRASTVAASILVLLLASFYLTEMRPEKANTESILQSVKKEYYRSPDILRASTQENDWGQFNLLYTNGEFSKAVEYLPNDNKPIVTFYRGLCYVYMSEPQWNNAIVALKSLSLSNNRFSDQASWYLAICHYENGQKTKAFDLWEKIASNDQHYKQSEAQILLQELSS